MPGEVVTLVDLSGAGARTVRRRARANTASLVAGVGLAPRAGHRSAPLSGGEQQVWLLPARSPMAPRSCSATSRLATSTTRDRRERTEHPPRARPRYRPRRPDRGQHLDFARRLDRNVALEDGA